MLRNEKLKKASIISILENRYEDSCNYEELRLDKLVS